MASTATTTTTSSWTEPPWTGWIETTGDALLILEAARRGLIPRVTRRLVDSERKMITSGSVFVFDEDESGIKRWTDGFFWSPSRILGNFLLYRETDKRGAGHRGVRSDPPAAPDVPLPGVNEHSQYNVDGVKLEGQTLSRPKGEASGMDKMKERTLVGSLTNSYKFKPDGMMKKTFSLTIGGVAQHLISYYKIEDVELGRLRSPSSLPELASLDISPEYLDKTHFRNPPKVEIGVDGVPRYRGEADDTDVSPRTRPAPLSSGPPLLLDSDSIDKRGSKRYDPYGAHAPSSASKRPRKPKAARGTGSDQQAGSSCSQPTTGYGNDATNTSHAVPTYGSYPPPAYYAMPHAYPHLYPPPAPNSNSPAPHVAAGSPTSPLGSVYSSYVPPSTSSDAVQSGQQPHSSYPYYPVPPPHYASYAPWPHYSTSYPPPQGPQEGKSVEVQDANDKA